MNNEVIILDSTLRDGGYCNNWEFGYENKKRIISGLINSNVEIVECGILSKGSYSQDVSKYSDIDALAEFLPKQKNSVFVLLMNYGEYDVETLPECKEDGITGIRVAFHKKDVKMAIQVMKRIKDKKYKVFMQPMVSVTYSSDEFVDLLEIANELEPYAFYIVDSFGSMKTDDLKKYCSLANYMLKDNILLGFHSHNNLQLAYSNAQLFVRELTNRPSIVDCCIMGMGRGAGNLNTELFLSYINTTYGERYAVEPILFLIDEIINIFYERKYWGYSLPNYLSAIYNMHPNYASYLADKNTLTISMLKEVLSLVDIEKKNYFDKEYIEKLYFSYMCASKMRGKAKTEFSELFNSRDVLIIAPGRSIDIEIDKIKEFLKNNNVISICVNFDLEVIKTDYIFLSNPKRYEEMENIVPERLIATSNIAVKTDCLTADYFSLLCEEKYIRDNAAMMLIKMLINSGARRVYLAGVDGYSKETKDNYTKYSTALVTSDEYLECMNKGMSKMLHKYSKEIDIRFVTSEKMIRR